MSLASGALIALAGSQVSASAATAPPPARVDAGTCEVTVEVHDPWGTGDKGIQLLLDSSHSTCGEFYNADQTFYFGDYSPFDLKLVTATLLLIIIVAGGHRRKVKRRA